MFAYVGAQGVAGAHVDSDWRCPEGNSSVRGADKSQHVLGTAGDFDVAGFNLDTWEKFAIAAEAAGTTSYSSYPGTARCAASPSKWCYSGYIHIDWR